MTCYRSCGARTINQFQTPEEQVTEGIGHMAGGAGGKRSTVVVMLSQEKLFLDDSGFCSALNRVITTDYD